MSNNIRIEEDLLGTREVPADAYYGVHTLRAIENFYISNNKISDIPEFVRGMVMVKKAAAMANKVPGRRLPGRRRYFRKHEHQRSAGQYRSGTDGSPER